MASFSERYHEFTKYHPLSIDRLNHVNWGNEPRPFKEHEGKSDFSMTPWLQHLNQMDKNNAPDEFGPSASSFVSSPEFLASLFFHSAGVTAAMQTEKGPFYFRANPSAGGLYPNESYIYLLKEATQFQEESLKTEQFFHFHPLNNQLYRTGAPLSVDELKSCFANAAELEEADFLIVITGLHERSVWRYGERAYRRQLLDAGHLAGNYQLFLNSKGKHHRFLSGFYDLNLQQKMGLQMELPLLVIAVKNEAFSVDISQYALGSIDPLEAYKNINTHNDIYVQQTEMELQFDPTPRELIPPISPLEFKPNSEFLPLQKNNLSHLKFVPLELLKRRSSRSFSTKLDAQGKFEKFSQIVDFAIENHPYPISHGHLNTWLFFKGDSETPRALFLLEPQKKLWIQSSHTPSWEDLIEACLGQEIAAQASAVIFHTSHLSNATKHLGDRVYRYLNFDAGIYGENYQIAANHMNFSTTGIGGYFDDMVNELLGLDLSEAIIYITLLGTPQD